jgi:hypothetical protein
MKKLTAKQKARAKARAVIAEDVIAQIKAEKYVARTGVYIGGLDISPANNRRTVDLQRHIKRTVTTQEPCRVCALGSAFLSCVRLYDKCELSPRTSDGVDGIQTRVIKRKLKEFFSPKELGAIESSFERHRMGSITFPQWEEVPTGYKHFLNGLCAEDRLLWLMRAVSRLADTKITLKALEQQALLSIALDKEFEGERWSRIAS